MLISVMYVMWKRTFVVEEFGIHRPCIMRIPEAFADDAALQLGYCVTQGDLSHAGAVLHDDETQAFVLARLRAVVRRRGGGEPTFVNPAPVPAHGIVVGRVQLDPPSWHAKRARNPCWRKPKYSLSLLDAGFGNISD